MKIFFRIIFKMHLIITILAGCTTSEEIDETDPVAVSNQGAAMLEEGLDDQAIACFNKAIDINPSYSIA